MPQNNYIGTTPMVNSVIHATKILELYAAQRKEYLTLAEISKGTKMHKTTVYRILRTLESVGWIEQSPLSGQYRLGNGILLVASAVSVHRTTKTLIADEMRKLSETFNETVVLSALRQNIGICVDMIKSHHSLSISPENGYIVPLESGATGKTLLSAQPQAIIDEILSSMPSYVAEPLEKQIKVIQEEGYCISEGEVDIGVAAIAAPLPMKDAVYTLTISGPQIRLEEIGYDKLREALLNTIEEIKQKSMLLI